MKFPLALGSSLVAALLGLSLSGAAEARPHRWHEYHRHHYHHHHPAYRHGHGGCLRFNKTTGTIAGVGVGGLVGHAVVGGTGGMLVGAAAGGLAGHELAHNGRKHCRR